MPITNACRKANCKWTDANRGRYWQCLVRFPASDKDAVAARAESLGIPVSEYIRTLVYNDLSAADHHT